MRRSRSWIRVRPRKGKLASVSIGRKRGISAARSDATFRAILIFLVSIQGFPAQLAHAQGEARSGESPRSIEATTMEPSLPALLAAGLERPGLSTREVDEAKRQARRSGALPRLTVRTRRIWDDSRRAEELAQGPRTRVDIDDNLLLEAQLQFDLGRLVYGTESIAWAREAREREHRRTARAREIVQLYYERERLLFELSTLHGHDREYELRIIEIEAHLDALTGGALTRGRTRPPSYQREAGARGIHALRAPQANSRAVRHPSNRSPRSARPQTSKEGIEERLPASEKEAMGNQADKGKDRGSEE